MQAEAEIEKKGCCEKFSDGLTGFFAFLYNKETGLVMGRNGESWAKIGFFYLIFYGFLAGFFSGMLAIFLTTLESPEEKGAPKLIQYLENQPGLNRLDYVNKLKLGYHSSPNRFELTDNYVKFVDSFLSKYQSGWTNSNKSCNESSEEGIPVGEAPCIFDRTLLRNCSGLEDQSYGLNSSMPCIFVRINKIYGWVPKSDDGQGYLKLKCAENVQVYPPGFIISAFPFRGQKPFELPVVAVQIDVKSIESVSCRLVGKGIEVSTSYVPYRAYGNIRIKDDKTKN